MSGLEIELVLLLMGIAAVAGCLDAIAGGGGLLVLPSLLLSGLDPLSAIATSKLQASFGSGSATLAFARARMINWRNAWPMALIAALGAILGTICISLLPHHWLEVIVPVMLIIMACYFALSPRMRDDDAKARLSNTQFTASAPLSVGFYDGIFGPGAGSFYMLSFVTLRGYGLVKATAHTKLLNFSSNLGSILLFSFQGHTLWGLGLLMGCSAFLGAQLGSQLAMKWGAKLVKPILVTMSCLMAIRLMMNPDNPLRLYVQGFFNGFF